MEEIDKCAPFKADNPQIQPSSFQSSWREPLPEDEIGRQQEAKESLKSGCIVNLCMKGIDLGTFRYSGLWDTMHAFYPAGARSLKEILPQDCQRYLRRDLRGREFLHIPYTILADVIKSV